MKIKIARTWLNNNKKQKKAKKTDKNLWKLHTNNRFLKKKNLNFLKLIKSIKSETLKCTFNLKNSENLINNKLYKKSKKKKLKNTAFPIALEH